jgi:hypothetical protein
LEYDVRILVLETLFVDSEDDVRILVLETLFVDSEDGASTRLPLP